jgi:sulfopyruvate decarboxylase alpha subunit
MSLHESVRRAADEAGIDVVAALPDSALWPTIEAFEDDPGVRAVGVTREEQAVGVLAGAWLAGSRGMLVCQSSGLANAFNALGSLAVPWGLPFVGVVSRRGDLGEHNGAQVPAGYGLPRLLDTVGVRNHHLSDPAEAERAVRRAAETAFSTESPYVVLVDPGATG